ncbi:filamin-A-like [Callithrix jacchus]
MKKNGQHVASSPIPVVISQSEIGVPATFRSLARASMKVTPLSLQSLSLIPEMQVGSCCPPVGAGTLYMAPKLRVLHPPGFGGLNLSTEGPSKVDINTEDLEDGTSRVTYCSTEPGKYIISIKFADQHMPRECSSALAAPLTTPGPRGSV